MKKLLLLSAILLVVTSFFCVKTFAIPIRITSATTEVCQNGVAQVFFINDNNEEVRATFDVNSGSDIQILIPANGSIFVNVSTANAGTFTYQLLSAFINKSGGNNIGVSNTPITITVSVAPSVTISGTENICEGSSKTITFSNARNVQTTVTYNINGGTNQQITVPGNGTTTLNQSGTFTGSPYVYNLASAQYTTFTPNCPTSIAGSATVSVSRAPSVTISGTDNICESSSKTITFTNARNTQTTVTYNINGGANQEITVPGNGTATVNQAGTLTGSPYVYNLVSVQYSSTPNCPTSIAGSATVTVKVAPPVPVIVWDGTQLSTNVTGVNYEWYFNNNLINGANTSAYTPTVNGTYKVTVIALNGCTASSQDYALTATNVTSFNPLSETWTKIYPNPAQNNFVISLERQPFSFFDIHILNSIGTVVKTFKSNKQRTILNIEDLPSGYYIVKIQSANYRQIKKLQIVK